MESDRKPTGLGYLPEEAKHGFVIDYNLNYVRVIDCRDAGNYSGAAPSNTDPWLRVLIDSKRWDAIAPGFWTEAGRSLRANSLPAAKFIKTPSKPVPVLHSLGKELCVLCWAVEDAKLSQIPNALHNWGALTPEERWWLYTMTVATTGQALKKGIGWRKALRAAIAENGSE